MADRSPFDALDPSESEGTQELPAADRTLEAARAEAPDAPEAPDATGEIGIEDIVEMQQHSKPAASDLSEMFGAITPKKLAELEREGFFARLPVGNKMSPASPEAPDYESPVEALLTDSLPQPPPAPMAAPAFVPPPAAPAAPLTQTQSMQRPQSYPDHQHPSSIAPFALDVLPAAPVAARRPMLESTGEIQRAAGIPQRPIWQMAVGIAGAAALSALVIGSVALGMPGTRGKHDADVALAAANASPDVQTTTRVADFEIDSRASEPAAAIVTPAAPQDAPRVQEDSPAPVVTQIGQNEEAPTAAPAPVVAAPAPHKAAAPAAAKPASKPAPSQTGELRVPAGVNGVLVDGAPRRVTGGLVVLACGNHKVKAPRQSPRTVNVPCGGSTSL